MLLSTIQCGFFLLTHSLTFKSIEHFFGFVQLTFRNVTFHFRSKFVFSLRSGARDVATSRLNISSHGRDVASSRHEVSSQGVLVC